MRVYPALGLRLSGRERENIEADCQGGAAGLRAPPRAARKGVKVPFGHGKTTPTGPETHSWRLNPRPIVETCRGGRPSSNSS
jgi:hypothetical protein